MRQTCEADTSGRHIRQTYQENIEGRGTSPLQAGAERVPRMIRFYFLFRFLFVFGKSALTHKGAGPHCKQVRRAHPTKVMLVRVGDFYEAYGYCAVVLVQYTGRNQDP